MLWTILIYSLCTGLSAASVTIWDFAFYRFLTGLGVGGEFAVGVALVAEVMPSRARPFALGLLQAFSAIGNVTAALVYVLLGYLELRLPDLNWRKAYPNLARLTDRLAQRTSFKDTTPPPPAT